jgi:hypothetical protein
VAILLGGCSSTTTGSRLGLPESAAFDRLALKVGDAVVVIVKATDVMIGK